MECSVVRMELICLEMKQRGYPIIRDVVFYGLQLVNDTVVSQLLRRYFLYDMLAFYVCRIASYITRRNKITNYNHTQPISDNIDSISGGNGENLYL